MSSHVLQKALLSINYLNFFEKRFGGPSALALLQQAGLLDAAPRNDTLKILDHACGMGLIASLLHEITDIDRRSPPTEFICGDISPQAIRAAEARIGQWGWKGITAKIIDAQDSKFPDNSFTHVLCSAGYALMPKPDVALKDSVRILEPAGVLGFTAWIKPGWVEDLNVALARLGAPSCAKPSVAGGWLDPTFIRSQVEETPGLDPSTIKIEPLSVDCRFACAQEWTDVAVGLLGVITADWTEDQKQEFSGRIIPELGTVLEEKYGVGKPFGFQLEFTIVTANKSG